MAKKKAHGHHGGAWKVAYADFVTAMMALFMVLWISAQDQEILLATSQYFQSPFNSPLDATTGVLPFGSNSTPMQSGEGDDDKANALIKVDKDFMSTLADEFYKLLNIEKTDNDAPISIEVTSDGLRITLFNSPERPLFQPDSTEFTEWGNFSIQNMAWVVDRYDFLVVVEAHTREGARPPGSTYSEWDLSTDQANSIRRALSYYAVESSRFQRVSGYGAASPLPGHSPEDLRNQRIVLSLIVNNQIQYSKLRS